MQERKAIKTERVKRLTVLLCLYSIRAYQMCLSPLIPRRCRFYPTCSQYFYEAIEKNGIYKGGVMGVKRILCCHPFHPGGYDPVK